jgi:hypothetical protein
MLHLLGSYGILLRKPRKESDITILYHPFFESVFGFAEKVIAELAQKDK